MNNLINKQTDKQIFCKAGYGIAILLGLINCLAAKFILISGMYGKLTCLNSFLWRKRFEIRSFRFYRRGAISEMKWFAFSISLPVCVLFRLTITLFLDELCFDFKCKARAVFNWVSKVISRLLWFCFTALCDWLTKFPPLSQPMRSKTQTNRASLARFFPRLAPLTCWLVLCVVFVFCDWSE